MSHGIFEKEFDKYNPLASSVVKGRGHDHARPCQTVD